MSDLVLGPLVLAKPHNGYLKHAKFHDENTRRMGHRDQFSLGWALCGVRGQSGMGYGGMIVLFPGSDETVPATLENVECKKCKKIMEKRQANG